MAAIPYMQLYVANPGARQCMTSLTITPIRNYLSVVGITSDEPLAKRRRVKLKRFPFVKSPRLKGSPLSVCVGGGRCRECREARAACFTLRTSVVLASPRCHSVTGLVALNKRDYHDQFTQLFRCSDSRPYKSLDKTLITGFPCYVGVALDIKLARLRSRATKVRPFTRPPHRQGSSLGACVGEGGSRLSGAACFYFWDLCGASLPSPSRFCRHDGHHKSELNHDQFTQLFRCSDSRRNRFTGPRDEGVEEAPRRRQGRAEGARYRGGNWRRLCRQGNGDNAQELGYQRDQDVIRRGSACAVPEVCRRVLCTDLGRVTMASQNQKPATGSASRPNADDCPNIHSLLIDQETQISRLEVAVEYLGWLLSGDEARRHLSYDVHEDLYRIIKEAKEIHYKMMEA